MKAVSARLRFFYGYSIKMPGQTSAKEPLPYPSPTTLVGALASAMGRAMNEPEVIRNGKSLSSYSLTLLGKIVWAAPALLQEKAIPFKTMTRLLTLPYQRKRALEQAIAMAFSVTTQAWMHYDGEAVATYITEDEFADEIAKYAWGIDSIGSKESLVDVLSVHTSELIPEGEGGSIKTPYPIPTECLSDIESVERGAISPYIPLTDAAYTQRPREETPIKYWLVPRESAYGGYLEVGTESINDNCGVYRIDVGGDSLVIVLPRGGTA